MILSVEFSALREECANLRRRIQDIEIEMKTSRRENHQLQTDYSKLQDSYKVSHEMHYLKDLPRDEFFRTFLR